MRSLFRKGVNSNLFNRIVILLIILNSILIGVELDIQNRWIVFSQNVILIAFAVEIAIRSNGLHSGELDRKFGDVDRVSHSASFSVVSFAEGIPGTAGDYESASQIDEIVVFSYAYSC